MRIDSILQDGDGNITDKIRLDGKESKDVEFPAIIDCQKISIYERKSLILLYLSDGVDISLEIIYITYLYF